LKQKERNQGMEQYRLNDMDTRNESDIMWQLAKQQREDGMYFTHFIALFEKWGEKNNIK